MAPFMKSNANGTQAVNGIRIIEQLIGAGVGAAIVLYVGHAVLVQRVDTVAESVERHIDSDIIHQKELRKWMETQRDHVITHETVLRQNNLLK